MNIFAGKAASAYYMAKHIIHLINDVAAVINNDPQIGQAEGGLYPQLQRVSLAQLIIPAADLVGTDLPRRHPEASGHQQYEVCP